MYVDSRFFVSIYSIQVFQRLDDRLLPSTFLYFIEYKEIPYPIFCRMGSQDFRIIVIIVSLVLLSRNLYMLDFGVYFCVNVAFYEEDKGF